MGQLAYVTETIPQTNNYAFIEHSFPGLYRLSQEIEKYYSTDHSCCLLKARMFVELWCHEVSEKFKLRPPVTGDLIDKIKQISSCNRVPGYVVDALNQLRVEGNKSVHISQSYDGSWGCEYTLSKYKLDNLMKSLLEITQYLAYKLNLQNADSQNVWQEPIQPALQEEVFASLSGNKEATFALAQHFVNKMTNASLHHDVSGKENKHKMQLLQDDLAYWLARAHKQGHQESWLLYATVYKNKQLQLPDGVTVESCFKEALKNDDDGEVSYQYGIYLVKDAQHQRALNLMHQAAEKANHQAIEELQGYYYAKDQQQYLYWLNTGITAKVKQSFTLDLAYKLAAWEQEKDNELLQKQVKTALISAQSRQCDGVKYFKGYCDLQGYWGRPPQLAEGLSAMVENHQQLPEFLHYQHTLFNLLKDHQQHAELALEIAGKALYCAGEESKAQMQFDIAMLICQKLRADKQVKSAHGLKALIRESAAGGCSEAIQFIKSPKGKALMRDIRVVSQKSGKKSVDRKKLNKANKKARKANR